MARIELRSLWHAYVPGVSREEHPERFAIRGIDLSWASGSANALLGPSGCGKTTILNVLSGLIRPTFGEVLLDGVDVTRMTPMERRIAQVFQFPVVYETMSVYDNIAFPLRNSGVSEDECRERVGKVAELLDLGDRLRTSAGRISQAEKQKVSLGRGIARKDTVAILLDEPLTVIDPKEKYVLRRKLREVQKELAITTIYVTHDQHEALTFADSVVVMNEGNVVQVGSPAALHTEPATPFVGHFIGSPGMNLLDCVLDGRRLEFGAFGKPLSDAAFDALSAHGREFRFGIRPEFVRCSVSEKVGWVPMSVGLVENMGTHLLVTLGVNCAAIRARTVSEARIAAGDCVWVDFPEERMRLFKGERRVW